MQSREFYTIIWTWIKHSYMIICVCTHIPDAHIEPGAFWEDAMEALLENLKQQRMVVPGLVLEQFLYL